MNILDDFTFIVTLSLYPFRLPQHDQFKKKLNLLTVNATHFAVDSFHRCNFTAPRFSCNWILVIFCWILVEGWQECVELRACSIGRSVAHRPLD